MESVQLIPTQATVVLYEEPVLVREVEDELDSVVPAVLDKTVEEEIKGMMALRFGSGCPDPKTYEYVQLDEILNTLIPPIEWIDDGKMYRQSVTSEDVTRDKILELAENLDDKLKSRQASLTGICPIRRQLYSQLFDELIRQITTLIPETGLILMRVRDELRMTVDIHKSLYESCESYVSKCINVPISNEDNQPNELELKVLEIETEMNLLQHQIRNIQDGLELKELIYKEMIDAENSIFEEEFEHLTKVKAQLEKQLELFKGPNPHAEPAIESFLDKFLNQGDGKKK